MLSVTECLISTVNIVRTWILDPLYWLYYEAKRNDTDLKDENVHTKTKSVNRLKQYCRLFL